MLVRYTACLMGHRRSNVYVVGALFSKETGNWTNMGRPAVSSVRARGVRERDPCDSPPPRSHPYLTFTRARLLVRHRERRHRQPANTFVTAAMAIGITTGHPARWFYSNRVRSREFVFIYDVTVLDGCCSNRNVRAPRFWQTKPPDRSFATAFEFESFSRLSTATSFYRDDG